MKTQIIPQRAYQNTLEQDIDGAIIFDGDGDGTSAAAIWLMQNPGKYVAVTNTQKSKRDLVGEANKAIPAEYLRGRKVAVLDISAEQNKGDLEQMANLGASIDFIDHHTSPDTKLPENVRNYAQPDSREISTASLAYEAIGKHLPEKEKGRAAQLAVVGLSNDGKGRAAQKSFEKEVPAADMERLLYYGRVLNYAASLGNTLDFARILSGLADSENILHYLGNSDVAEVAKEMETSLSGLQSRIRHLTTRQAEVYLFPAETEKDVVLGLASYSNYLNAQAENAPQQYHIGVLRTDAGKTRFALRGPSALKLAEALAVSYNTKALGRETAAGFDTSRNVAESELAEMLNSGA